MGDGIRPNVEVVLSTRPDLVVLYATGDNRDAARAFRAAGIDVLSLRMNRIEEFEHATRLLGDVLGAEAAAGIIVDSVRATLERVRLATRDLERPSVFLLSWPNPLLTIGAGSFLSQLVEIAGGRNLFDDLPDPSPAVSFEEVLRRDPDVVLAGPQRLAMMRASGLWNTLPAVRGGRMLQLDTALTGRPGVRLGEAAVSIARLLHPERVR
jgi:iron complex transport system substrate-binding protein